MYMLNDFGNISGLKKNETKKLQAFIHLTFIHLTFIH